VSDGLLAYQTGAAPEKEFFQDLINQGYASKENSRKLYLQFRF